MPRWQSPSPDAPGPVSRPRSRPPIARAAWSLPSRPCLLTALLGRRWQRRRQAAEGQKAGADSSDRTRSASPARHPERSDLRGRAVEGSPTALERPVDLERIVAWEAVRLPACAVLEAIGDRITNILPTVDGAEVDMALQSMWGSIRLASLAQDDVLDANTQGPEERCRTVTVSVAVAVTVSVAVSAAVAVSVAVTVSVATAVAAALSRSNRKQSCLLLQMRSEHPSSLRAPQRAPGGRATFALFMEGRFGRSAHCEKCQGGNRRAQPSKARLRPRGRPSLVR